jgi:hypothetical protein
LAFWNDVSRRHISLTDNETNHDESNTDTKTDAESGGGCGQTTDDGESKACNEERSGPEIRGDLSPFLLLLCKHLEEGRVASW